MSGHDIVVMGASAGGVEALREVVGGLPAGLPAAVFVVLHVPPTSPSVLQKILDRAGPLPAAAAVDGEHVKPGRVYVSRPDQHLLLEDGHVLLARGPKENRHRPAVDALMRSAAVGHGPRCVGVLLSGALSDGTAGLAAVKRRGGVAVVQDPTDALFPGMPGSALEHVPGVDHTLPAREIGPLLGILAREEAPDEGDYPVPDEMELEARIARLDPDTAENVSRLGHLSSYTCPECDGPLWEIQDSDDLLRFRCRVGHAYAAEDMLEEKLETLESALWAALNTLKESAEFSRRLANDSRARGRDRAAVRFDERAENSERQAALISRALAEMRVNDPF
jgi:two-component system chemotaxis response regulator CheB